MGGLLLIILLGGLAVFAATELTAKSTLFGPLRERLLHAAARAAARRQGGLEQSRWQCRSDPVIVFIGDAWVCPFCSSCWHAAWVAAVVGLHAGWAGGAIAYLPIIATAKLLHDFSRRR